MAGIKSGAYVPQNSDVEMRLASGALMEGDLLINEKKGCFGLGIVLSAGGLPLPLTDGVKVRHQLFCTIY